VTVETDEFGLTEADWEEMRREEAREQLVHRCKAFWMVLTTNRGDDLSWLDPVEYLTVKFLCLLCLLCWWRDPIREHRPSILSVAWDDDLDMGYFDLEGDWYGAGAQVLKFNPAQFRVEIFHESA
jgi:hypothetical protein